MRFAPGAGLEVNGALSAVGSSGRRILFTSNLPAPTPGSWAGIQIRPKRHEKISRISYSTLQYGRSLALLDSGAVLDNVVVADSDGVLIRNESGAVPTISNSLITRNRKYGVYLEDPAAVMITRTTISDNASYALGLGPGRQGRLLGFRNSQRFLSFNDVKVTGNKGGRGDGIEYAFNSILFNEVFPAGLDWIVNVGLEIPKDSHLTIEPGATVRFGEDASLTVNGRLDAVGTQQKPIFLVADVPVGATGGPTGQPGGWRGVGFSGKASSPSHLRYVHVEGAGRGGGGGAVDVSCSAPRIEFVVIAQCTGRAAGLTIYHGQPRLEAVRLEGCRAPPPGPTIRRPRIGRSAVITDRDRLLIAHVVDAFDEPAAGEPAGGVNNGNGSPRQEASTIP